MNLNLFKLNDIEKPDFSASLSTRSGFRGIEVISSTDIVDSVDSIAEKLDLFVSKTKIPESLFKHPKKTDSTIDIDIWRIEIENFLENLLEIIKKEELIHNDLYTKIVLCTVPFFCNEYWSSEKACLLSNDIYSECFSQNKHQNLSFDLIQNLLKNYILPVFKPQIKEPTISFSSSTQKDNATEYGNLLWKQDPRMFLVLKWLFQQDLDFSLYTELLLPPMLVVLYDHEFEFRRFGIQFISKMITNISPKKLKILGIRVLFKEGLINCLLFDSEAGNTLIADEALDSLLLLNNLTEHSKQEGYYKFLNYDIVQWALKRAHFLSKKNKLENISWFIQRAPDLIPLLGPYLHSHLQSFLSIVYKGLEIPDLTNSTLNTTLPLLSCETFNIIYSSVSGRVENHVSRILVAVLRCWSLLHLYKAHEENVILSNKLIEIVKKLDSISHTEVQTGLRAIVDADPYTYENFYSTIYP